MGQYRAVVTKDIRGYLEKKDMPLAISRTATDLEWVLWAKLFFENRIPSEIIDGATLGKFVQWNYKLGMLDVKEMKLLSDFVQFRNAMVHTRVLLDNLKMSQERMEIAKGLITRVCDYIGNVQVKTDGYNSEVENSFSQHSVLEEKKTVRLFEKLKSYKENF